MNEHIGGVSPTWRVFHEYDYIHLGYLALLSVAFMITQYSASYAANVTSPKAPAIYSQMVEHAVAIGPFIGIILA